MNNLMLIILNAHLKLILKLLNYPSIKINHVINTYLVYGNWATMKREKHQIKKTLPVINI